MVKYYILKYLEIQYKISIYNILCYFNMEEVIKDEYMKYSYNRLWKILIDRKITKTELRLQTNISTNMLAKMGKDEPVSMETLAKISTYLKCGLDEVDPQKAGAGKTSY